MQHEHKNGTGRFTCDFLKKEYVEDQPCCICIGHECNSADMPEKPTCDHVCTSDCRRDGCGCACGEWHDEAITIAREAAEDGEIEQELLNE